jgi:hypothetical protein
MDHTYSILALLFTVTSFKMFGDPTVNPRGWDSYSLEEIAEVHGGVKLFLSL